MKRYSCVETYYEGHEGALNNDIKYIPKITVARFPCDPVTVIHRLPREDYDLHIFDQSELALGGDKRLTKLQASGRTQRAQMIPDSTTKQPSAEDRIIIVKVLDDIPHNLNLFLSARAWK